MTRNPRKGRAQKTNQARAERRFAALWHLAWAFAAAAAAAGLGWSGRLELGPAPSPALWAIAAGGAPALLGALVAEAGARRGWPVALSCWAIGGASACLLTGGAQGPLAAWCLAPLAAAVSARRAELLPLGAALAVAATAVGVLGGVLMPTPAPPLALGLWLSVLALGTVTLGLGSGLVAVHGRFRREIRSRDDVETSLLELLENQPQLLLAVYPGGRMLEAFGPAPLGRPSRELVDRNFLDLIAVDDRPKVEDALQRGVAEGACEITARPAHDPEGCWEITLRRMSSIRLTAAVRDAKAQRAREAELERARISAEQQNAGKSRFLANMSHELRTPLNAIMGFSDIMRQRLFGPMSERYAEYAELVHESGAHLLELINDVLDMSKIEADRFELARESFDARETISGALRLLRGQADRAGVSLRGVLPGEPLPARADRRALKQIAINLVSNALRFTPRGGSVTLTLQPSGDVLELVVADTGVGIAPDDLERLGRPFEQAGDAAQKAGGSGLGLSLVRAFAQLHGGEMRVESALGEGTTVIVRLPVLEKAEAVEEEPRQAAEA